MLKQTEELLRQKDVLLQEMQHRVANSLQIIASILLLKARAVSSEETRQHLKDAHQRVMSVAAVQQHLHASDGIDQIEVESYLSKLCDSLGSSMIGESQPIAIKVMADEGTHRVRQGRQPRPHRHRTRHQRAQICVPGQQEPTRWSSSPTRSTSTDWKLVVSDNGVGKNAADDVGKTADWERRSCKRL